MKQARDKAGRFIYYIPRPYCLKICPTCGKRFRCYQGSLKKYCSDSCHPRVNNRIPISKKLRKAIMDRDGGACVYCRDIAECVDHVNPASNGGATTMDNLVACCNNCNMTALDRVFDSISDKRKYILKTRKIKSNELHHDTYERPFWHRFVYGGVRH